MTCRRFVILALTLILVLQPVLLVVGMHTGFIGYTFVEGNSMSSVFPWGCLVVIMPLTPREGDYVIAWTWGGMDGASEASDKRRGFVVKRLVHNRLESTDSGEQYSKDYRVTGVVVRYVESQKVLWWMNRGSDVPKLNRTQQQQEAIDDQKRAIAQGHSATEAAKGLLQDQQLILGPAVTRPTTLAVVIPAGARRVCWEAVLPPLTPAQKVFFRAGKAKKILLVDKEGAHGVTGGMNVPSGCSELKMGIVDPVSDRAVELRSVRFYDH